MTDSKRVMVRGYVFSDDGRRIPIEVEIEDPETIDKLQKGFVNDFSFLAYPTDDDKSA